MKEFRLTTADSLALNFKTSTKAQIKSYLDGAYPLSDNALGGVCVFVFGDGKADPPKGLLAGHLRRQTDKVVHSGVIVHRNF